MHGPDSSLDLPIAPNRRLYRAAWLAGTPLALLPFWLPLPLAARLVLCAAILVALRIPAARLVQWKGPRAVRGIRLREQRCTLRLADRTERAGRIDPASRIWSHLALLRIIVGERHRPVTLLLCDLGRHANVSARDFRRIRVHLRHSRHALGVFSKQ